MVQTLERGGLLGLSSLQNCVGIELAREQGDLKDQEFMAIPEYSQTSVYQKEAFKCFKASMELGSREGAYNMGICYEQGIGTSVNLDKARYFSLVFIDLDAVHRSLKLFSNKNTIYF